VIRSGLIAAALVLASVILGAAGRSAYAAAAREDVPKTRHYCAVTDRDFIETARVNVAAVGLYGDDYLRGDADGAEVIAAARDATVALQHTSPFDPSLAAARRYLTSMFTEYERAVRVRDARGDAAGHMYRAYSLGAHARDVLAAAQPPLARLGCDVRDLL
jgi:hypothetical protein